MGRVNIIGAGLAGLSAAITLAQQGIETNLVSLQPSERAQSVLAEGGVNAALDTMGEHDTTAEHFADTMRGGVDLADPNAVAGLTSQAPEIVTWLHSLGVPFQMEGDRILLRNFGGQKKKRTAFAKSSTGKALMTALIDEARKYEARGVVRRWPHHELIDLKIESGECVGAVIRDVYAGEAFFLPGPVILASGGLNGLFPGMTTGTTQNGGDATALAFLAGAELGNLEFLQYHPTTVQITGKRMLVSEAARGEGGRLFLARNGQPWYFMEERYPELGNLMPRDVISREMVKVVARPDCGDQVYLDLTGLPKATWEKKLPDLRSELIHYLAIDPAIEPVPVSPGIHYFMGGILVDERHRTNIPGLYAAGECACQYHGANRLGGNSMLGAIYGGKVAAEAVSVANSDGDEIKSLGIQMVESISPIHLESLKNILLDGLGILRTGESIIKALDRVDALLGEDLTLGEKGRALVGKAMLLSALERRESRGAHTRTDFPQRDDVNFRKTTVSAYRAGKIGITFRDLPERRDAP